MTTPSVGVLLGNSQTPRDILRAAIAAQEAGFDEIWVGEDFFLTGGVSAAAAVLANTTLPVGLGIVSAVTRHPAVLAMEVATLDGMYPGRVSLGLGAGVAEWLDQLGVRPKSVLGAIRNCLTTIRELFEGKRVDVAYPTFALSDATLEHPPSSYVPLYVGASGPKMLALSGGVADGTILSVMSGDTYVRWAREQVNAGGAGDSHRLVTYTFCLVDDDPLAAREGIRELFASYVFVGPRNPLTEVQGIADLAEELASLEDGTAVARIPDEWLTDLAVTGTGEQCAARIQDLAAAGSNSVVLNFPPECDVVEQIQRVGRDVLPLLRMAGTDAEGTHR